jgi:hypothetical protein
MLSRARLALALVFALAATSSVARAQIEAPGGVSASPPASIPREDSFESARSLALGLGNRATTSSTAALASNVANMAMIPVYDL